ncbi:MAG: DUF5671 domain-containing protein [Planctomycetota bacterium]
MNESLRKFVDHARDNGLDHGTIWQLLHSAGWQDEEIASSIAARDLDLEIPTPSHSVSRSHSWATLAKDAVVHVVTYIALFYWVTNLALLWLLLINLWVPDEAWRISDGELLDHFSWIRFEASVLIVAFPVFLVGWVYLLRDVRRHPEKAKTFVRRAFAYVTTAFAGAAIAGDAIYVTFLFLNGELTTRLILRGAALTIAMGSVIFYLLYTLRSEAEAEESKVKMETAS